MTYYRKYRDRSFFPSAEDFKDLKLVFSPESIEDIERMAAESGRNPQEMIDEINALFTSGKFFENAKPVDIDALDPEMREMMEQRCADYDDDKASKRKFN